MRRTIQNLKKKFYPVIHVVDEKQTFDNIEIAIEANADGVFLISHGYLNHIELLELGKKIKNKYPDLWIGYNFLNIFINKLFYELPNDINSYCDAIWIDDSRRGLNKTEADKITEAWNNSIFKGQLFGGVAFKYKEQPSNLKEAVKDSMGNMSVITTSGDGTGKAANPEKIREMFFAITDGTPLAIASGVDSENIEEYLPYATCFLVSTGISINHSKLDKEKAIELGRLIHN